MCIHCVMIQLGLMCIYMYIRSMCVMYMGVCHALDHCMVYNIFVCNIICRTCGSAVFKSLPVMDDIIYEINDVQFFGKSDPSTVQSSDERHFIINRWSCAYTCVLTCGEGISRPLHTRWVGESERRSNSFQTTK